MKKCFAMIIALLAAVAPAFSQDWDKQLIDQLKKDKTVEKSIVVNRNHETREIDTESLTFRFSSKKLYSKIYNELMAHQDEAERFSSDDTNHSITMRTYKNGLYSLYNLNGKGKYVFKVYRSVEKPSDYNGTVDKGKSSRRRTTKTTSRSVDGAGNTIVVQNSDINKPANWASVSRAAGNVFQEVQANEERVKRAAAERARKLKQ